MKDYYQILGLQATASASQIKARFRLLVVRYHPDKNSTPEAASIIREINEAYDVLSDPEKKRKYDNRFMDLFAESVIPTPHRDPAYRRTQPPRPVVDAQFELMKQSMPAIQWLVNVAAVFCVFLMFDFLLPTNKQTEIIFGIKVRTSYSRGDQQYFSNSIYTDKGTRFQIDLVDNQSLEVGDEVTVEYSAIQNIPIQVWKADEFSVNIRATIYGNFMFAPVVLIFLVGFGFYFRNNVRTAFNFGIVILFVLLLCLYFIKVS